MANGNKPITTVIHTGFTSLGAAATARVLLGGVAVTLPAWAKSILAVLPVANAIDPVTAESIMTLCEVESGDLALLPFQCMPAPTGATLLGASVSCYQDKIEKYSIGCPVNGGEQINVYISPLVACTVAPMGGASLVVSNMPAGHPQRHAKTGTLTSTGTTASTDVSGTRYNFSGARHIIEMFAQMAGTTVTTVRGSMGYVKYTSPEFDGVADVKLPLNAIAGGQGTDISQLIPGVSRLPVDIPMQTTGQCSILDYLYLGQAPATAGNFISGILYE